MSSLTTLIQYSTGISSDRIENRSKLRNKSLFVDNMIVYMENPKESTNNS